MTRTLEVQQELREAKRRDALVKALEWELPGYLEIQGIELKGFAIRTGAFDTLMTLKADIGGKPHVAFIGSDTIINCILKATAGAKGDTLAWRPDKYKTSAS